MNKALWLIAAAIISLTPSLGIAADATPAPAASLTPAPTFTDAQRTEIESILRDYLVNKHPEVLADAMTTLQKREQDSAEAKTKDELAAAKERVFNDPTTPFGGNPKANVTVVEFYDYQCGYCKMSEDAVEHLLKDDKNVKVIFKDFPILGATSVEAAKASLASTKQGKFQAFHDALMSKKEHLTSDMIYQVAKDVGLDVDRLKKDMADSQVDDAVNANLKLGQDIGVRGTPMFIINDTVYPGALQYEQLKQAVSDARTGGKKS